MHVSGPVRLYRWPDGWPYNAPPGGPHFRLASWGPYEIAEQIGVGGMGEVYRATDTNLKRAVAIKVLPVLLAADG